MNETLRPDVLIIGGGPAGLTAARSLRRLGVAGVLVLDREEAAGGIPRHSDHLGYGIRDLRSVMKGPAYARRLVDRAQQAGAEIITSATVTGWAGERSLLATTPRGRIRVETGAVILATGARERPRAARMVPGDRPLGVFTTGQLQQEVHLRHAAVGARAVIVGSELVSWSAVLTLRDAGCRVVLMTTEFESPEVYAPVAVAGRALLDGPIARRSRVVRVIGRTRVEAVEIEHLVTGQRRMVTCDTVVFTGDWVPDHELARSAGIDLDPGHRGPLVDTALATSVDGVFAAGNLLHPVDTADVAALDGRHVAASVVRWLGDGPVSRSAVRLVACDPFDWVAPGLIGDHRVGPPRDRLLLWSHRAQAFPTVVARQGGAVIGRRTLPWPVSPGRVFRVPWSLVRRADPLRGDVTIGLG
ncbi:MAG: FAD-dependent oxidoreductase [Actinobacteria bacterium]|nr:FAD-dependent oxidoreductase [Actinomycetota bacterium]